MSFKDASWSARFTAMGDQAESQFEAWCERNEQTFLRWGLDRPPLHMASLPERIRHSPDYLQSRRFVECQGFGRDQKVKLKLVKRDCLMFWNSVHPVDLFLYDSANEREAFISIRAFNEVLGSVKTEIRQFPEGGAYFQVNADDVFDAAELVEAA